MLNHVQLRPTHRGRQVVRRCLCAATGVALWVCAGASDASSGSSTAKIQASDLEPGPLKRQILDVQKQSRAGGHPRSLVEGPLGEAVAAAERARGARAAGDKWHSGLLTKLGMQWARCGGAVVRATEAEAKSRAEAKRLRELTTQLERAEALLAEHQARLGRLQAEVAKAEKKAAAAAEVVAGREVGRLERASKGQRPKSRRKSGGGSR